jgi:hypothetical protein
MNAGNFESLLNVAQAPSGLLFGALGIILLMLISALLTIKGMAGKIADERGKRDSLEIQSAKLREENRSVHLDLEQLERNYRRLGAERAELEKKLRGDGGKSG